MIHNETQKTEQQSILVVDDTPASLRLLTNILSEHGYRIRPATDGHIALRSVEAEQPDLILLDVQMPGMNGYEVCRRLKSDEYSRPIPVIFISAYGETTDKIEGFKAGGVDFITKPFEPAEVLARVNTHLRLRELTERLELKVDEKTRELTVTNQRLEEEIAERHRAEEALRKNESRVRNKLDAVLSPEGDIDSLDLADIIDIEALRSIMDEFYRLTHIGVGLFDLNGNELHTSVWQDICSKFHRVHPETKKNCIESDKVLSQGVESGKLKSYMCKNNMWDICSPIYLGEKHIGNLFLGQFFFEDEEINYDVFRAQSHQYGFDEKEYLDALDRVPRYSRDTVEHVTQFYSRLTVLISKLGYSNLKLTRTLEALKQAVEALRESEALLSQTQSLAKTGGWKYTVSSGSMVWTDEVYHIYEIPRDSNINDISADVNYYHPEDRPLIDKAFKKAVEKGKPYDLVLRFISANGTHKWVRTIGRPVEKDGKTVAVSGNIIDITEQKTAEIALLESERKFRSYIEVAPVIIICLTSDGRIQEFNPAAERLYSRKREEVIGQNYLECFVPEDNREDIKNNIEKVLNGVPTLDYVNPVRATDGTRRLISWNVERLLDSQGNPTGIIAIGQDVTEQKEAEKQQKDQIHFLESLEKIDDSIRQSTDQKQTLNNIVETVLSIFECDRAWLLYPGDPDAPSYRIPVEITRPEYPGAFALNQDIPMGTGAGVVRAALSSDSPVTFGPDADYPVYKELAEQFNVQSFIVMAIHPKIDKPWGFGMHQCSYARVWTQEEQQLFKEIGRRVSDALSSLLFLREVRESEERYHTIFENTPIALWEYDITDLDEYLNELQILKEDDPDEYFKVHSDEVMKLFSLIKLVDVNNETVRLYKAKTKEDIIRHLGDTPLPEATETFINAVKAYIRGEKQYNCETVNRTLDGSLINILYRVTFQKSGRNMKIAHVSVVDITERKKAEQRIRESEDMLNSIITSIPDIVYRLDRKGMITYVSDGVAAYGYSVKELIGMNFLEFVHPDDIEKARGFVTDWETYDGKNKSLELRMLRNDRPDTGLEKRKAPRFSLFLVSARGLYQNPEHSPEGFIGTQGIARDITDRKELEMQFYQSQKMESIGRLAGGVAHDFNNLLTVITGNAELALSEITPSGSLYENIDEIRTTADRASSLIRQLLAFSRHQVIESGIIRLNDVLDEMEKMLRRIVSENIELVTHIDKNLWPIKIDPGQLEQVITNLVVNARDAMTNGGVLTIETSNMSFGKNAQEPPTGINEGDYVLITVSDTGSGMDDEILQNIFEPFFTTKEKGKGTGLGLSTCYGILNQNGGYIRAYSEPGIGSSFRIYLPKATVEIEQDRGKQQPARQIPQGTETVLVVEDERSVRRMLVRILQNSGYTVYESQNGAEAREFLENFDGVVDIVITDMIMPKMGGRELSEFIITTLPHCRIILISGYTDEGVMFDGRNESEICFLQKPFPPALLISKVRQVLDA